MKIVLIDGYNLIHKCRFEGPVKIEATKENINKVFFNALRALISFIKIHKPDLAYFVIEGFPKKRSQLFANYKGSRKIDENDVQQVNYWKFFNNEKRSVINFIKQYLNIAVVKHPDHECDDVIAALAQSFSSDNNEIVLISRDTDFIQLHDLDIKNLKIWDPISKDFSDTKIKNYAIFKAITGDKTDDIPGVKGIGKVGAKKYSDNPQLLNGLSKDAKAQFDLSFELVKFEDVNMEDAEVKKSALLSKTEMIEKFKEIGFLSMAKDSYIKSFYEAFETMS